MTSTLHLPDLGRVRHLDLGSWREGIRFTPVTRFAPSPTGVLHLGHVVHAIFVWGLARASGGTVILRFEDHDRVRCRPEYERAILDDLEWLGFEPNAGLSRDGDSGVSAYRQSDCHALYEEPLRALRGRTDVYACECSRRTIREQLGTATLEDHAEVPYPGTCRGKRLAMELGRGLRVRLPDQVVSFDDLALGAIEQRPANQCGDVLVVDRRGHWTYQWSVVVDDIRHGVNLVIRGEDLVSSTGRQLLLHDLLESPSPPQHLHHPLILDRSGRKLGKRHGAAGIGVLRDAGYSAQAVLGYAAYLAGLRPEGLTLRADDVGALFYS